MRNKLLHCYIAKLLNRRIWKMRKNQSNNITIQQFNNSGLLRGVTLIELLLYMGLLALFLLVLTDIFVAITSVRTETETTSAVEQDGRFIISRLAYDVSRADSISIPPQLGQT